MKFFFIAISLFVLISICSHAQQNENFKQVTDSITNESMFIGECFINDVLALPQFARDEVTALDPKDIDFLKEHLSNYELICFIGTWCEDSQQHLPVLMDVISLSNYPLDKLKLYALDRDKKSMNKEEKIYAVEWLPTIIVLKDGKEIGRITEHPTKGIAEDLVTIIHP